MVLRSYLEWSLFFLKDENFVIFLAGVIILFVALILDRVVKLKKEFKKNDMKKIFILIFCLLTSNVNSMEKETTFSKELFDKAKSEGKIVIISSWIKYCSSCASQMKVLNKAKKEGKLSDIEFTNIEYFVFDVTNKEIADLFNIQYQTTLLIFKGNKEVYRSIGETTEDLIYEAIKASI